MRFQVLYLASVIAAAAPIVAHPVAPSKQGEAAVPPTSPVGLPKDVTINCKLGQCSESDLETLRQVLELTKSKPDDVEWDITSKITPVKHDPAVSTLERRDDIVAGMPDAAVPEAEKKENADGVENPEDLEKAEQLVERINHCSSDDCTEEELAALEDDIQVAFWGDLVRGIIGGIIRNIDFDLKFDFNYRNKQR